MQRSRLNDPKRLAAIRRLRVLDSPPEEVFDRLTRIAATLVKAPIALCSIVAPDRQFFKSTFGLPEPWTAVRETPLSHSFCQHVVLGLQPLIIRDARLDDRVKDNRAVPELGAIAYAGMPLLTPEGEALGSFCVIDSKPRDWTPDELSILKELADLAMGQFQLQDITRQLVIEQQLRQELNRALVEDLSGPLDRMTYVLQTADPLDGLSGPSVDEIVAESQHLRLKLNDIIDVGRLESGNLEPELRPVDLDPILAEALAHTYHSTLDKRITIEARVPDDLPSVIADPAQIARVVETLLRHAIRFTDVGSLVFLEASAQGAEVRCSVSDTGMGLSEDVRSRLFETALPHLDTPDDTPHSGLGLTYCRAAIEAHGGSIGVFSQEGLGTTIWFTLPVASEE